MSMPTLGERAEAVKRALVDPLAVVQALGLEIGERNGRAVKVLCPWHAEKTASCNVRVGDEDINVHCFGPCGPRGSVLDLIGQVRGWDMRGADFRRVVEYGEQLAGIAPPDDVRPPDLAAFARARCISPEVLRRFNVQPIVWFGRPALRYSTPLGIDRLKFTDTTKPKYQWTKKGGRSHWYGLEEALV